MSECPVCGSSNYGRTGYPERLEPDEESCEDCGFFFQESSSDHYPTKEMIEEYAEQFISMVMHWLQPEILEGYKIAIQNFPDIHKTDSSCKEHDDPMNYCIVRREEIVEIIKVMVERGYHYPNKQLCDMCEWIGIDLNELESAADKTLLDKLEAEHE